MIYAINLGGGKTLKNVNNKAIENFGGKIVRKDLTAMMKRGANVPTYVLEYLLGMYCSTDDEQIIASGIKKIKKILIENFVHPEESEKIKSLIREKGEYTIIDKIHARLDENNDIYSARFSNLDINTFQLPDEYAVNHTKVLMGGIWCMVRIAYQYPEATEEKQIKKKRVRKSPADSPFKILSLKPIQMADIDIDEAINNRKLFTSMEWETLILRSSGIEPRLLNDKERLHFIQRLVPLVERNYNLCELGPRGTGKSHIYKEISPYSILVSGGQSSSANLFYNLNTSQIGLVGHWDCVAFDEVAGMDVRDMNTIQILKDYMASGSFSRGREHINADASMVFVGNINDTVENLLKNSHLFDPFPNEIKDDSAFFDRFHYYLPGWEIPKIRADLLTTEYGLITDFLAEFSREMRKRDFSHCFDKWFKLNSNITTRDEIAIRKTVSGLTKLLYPDQSYSKDELEVILTYAIEGRRRVKEQLYKMAGQEFADVDLGYTTDEGREVIVYVPEQSSGTLIPFEYLPPGHIYAIGRSFYDGNTTAYRLENKTIVGSGKMEMQGVGGYGSKSVRESINASWFYFLDNAQKVTRMDSILNNDYLVYYGDILNRGISEEISVAQFIGFCSAASNLPVRPSIAVLGVLTLSGSISEIKNLSDYVRSASNAGAQYLLLPSSFSKDYLSMTDINQEIIIPLYYNDPIEAARIALEIDGDYKW